MRKSQTEEIAERGQQRRVKGVAPTITSELRTAINADLPGKHASGGPRLHAMVERVDLIYMREDKAPIVLRKSTCALRTFPFKNLLLVLPFVRVLCL